jgi:protein phosphatase
MVRKGVLDKEEARNHPRRNVITRAVGLRREVEVDVHPSIKIRTDEAVVLCTDGLFSMVTESEIADIVANNDPQPACDTLVKRAKEEGGSDNITVIIAQKT